MAKYNKERKDGYIEETKEGKLNYKEQMETCFSNTEPKETELEKDVCDFSKEEYIDFLKSLSTSSYERLLVVVSQLNRYAHWCSERKLQNGNYFPDELSTIELNDCCLKKDNIITREQLLKEISILPNPSDQFVVLALFEGICGIGYNEFLELTMDDFEETENGYVVHLPTRDLTVTQKLYEIADLSSKEYKNYRYAEGLTFDTREFKHSKKIIKEQHQTFADSEKQKGIRIKNKLSRIEKYLGDPKIKKAALFESGRIHMIKELMKNEHIDDMFEILQKYEKEISERYGKVQSKQRWALRYAEYFKD